MIYMQTKLGYIDGKCGSIYGIHTDPMGYIKRSRFLLENCLFSFMIFPINESLHAEGSGTSQPRLTPEASTRCSKNSIHMSFMSSPNSYCIPRVHVNEFLISYVNFDIHTISYLD